MKISWKILALHPFGPRNSYQGFILNAHLVGTTSYCDFFFRKGGMTLEKRRLFREKARKEFKI